MCPSKMAQSLKANALFVKREISNRNYELWIMKWSNNVLAKPVDGKKEILEVKPIMGMNQVNSLTFMHRFFWCLNFFCDSPLELQDVDESDLTNLSQQVEINERDGIMRNTKRGTYKWDQMHGITS